MRIRTAFLLSILLTVVTLTPSHAQGLLDGLRLTTSPTGTGARGLSMGGAMIASANDWSALEFNPAALTIIEHNEFSLSVFNKGYTSDARFLGTTTSNSITNTIPYSFAYAAPVPTERGHLAFALSIDRVQDFTSTYKFSAINPSSSFFNTKGFVNDPGYRGGNFNQYLDYLYQTNLAYAIYLTNNPSDSLHAALTTPYAGKMLQSGTVTQEGGMNAFRIGAGIDVAENVAVGGTVNVFFGSYDYRRTYSESDVNHVYANPDSLAPYNLASATIIDDRSQSISGVSLKLGLFSEPNEFLRIGVTFTTPTIYSLDDHFSRWGIATFANNLSFSSQDSVNLNPSISNSYTMTSPMTFAGGLSFNHWGLTLAASAEYTDYSQLRFSGTDVDLSDLNDASRNLLGGVLSWKVGGEYLLKPLGLLVRAGYSSTPSAYKADPTGYGTHAVSAGLGFLLSQSTILELSYRRSTYQTDHAIYNDLTAGPNATPVSAIINQDDVKLDELVISFSFRF
jgi:hypothetical protein